MNALKKSALLGLTISAIALSGCLGGGSDNDDAPVATPDPTPNACPTEGTTPDGARAQQQRIDDCEFVVNTAQVNDFDALPGLESQRWTGVLDNAGYRIEVPSNWNGQLVMWAHGYRGTGTSLTIDNPPMRQRMLELGYAWAASTYSANFYDVKAGVEDTNRLALNFSEITELEQPTKYLIAGYSMGGHVTGAAIELDNKAILASANLDVPYAAALPMCGVMGDTALFDYFGAYNAALLTLAGQDATPPVSDAAAKLEIARQALWQDYETDKSALGLTARGGALFPLLQNLTGGERPVYQVTFGEYQDLLQGFAGSDGSVDGIVNGNISHTEYLRYRFGSVSDSENGSPQLEPNMPEDPYVANLTTEESGFNTAVPRATPDEGVNDSESGELQFIPEINGNFDIPVLTLHGLGDLFVPISMEQIYRKRAEANGNGELLVQRAIRDPGHCEFTTEEVNEAFEALISWEQDIDNKPAGDDLLDPELMAQDDFGCQFTREDRLTSLIPACASFQVAD